MKLFWILCIIFVCRFAASGQVPQCDSIYYSADKMPVFGEGNNDLYIFLADRVRFAEECRPEGGLILSFIIDKSGDVASFDIAGLKDSCKDEALRIIDGMPGWKPGIINNQLVCAKVVVPMYVVNK